MQTQRATTRIALGALMFVHLTQTISVVEPAIKQRFAHNPEVFTQGLLLINNTIFESAGQYGKSSLQEVDVESGAVHRTQSLDAKYFAEGLALLPANNQLVQLTWKNGEAFVYNAADFSKVKTWRYKGDGWGLCYDDASHMLVMSNGGSSLSFHETENFGVESTLFVTSDGNPRNSLNELECVGEHIYANVWRSQKILRIQRRTGKVDCEIDASGLLTEEERIKADVLNGIAFDSESGLFLVTGKYWPWIFQVDFGVCGPCSEALCFGPTNSSNFNSMKLRSESLVAMPEPESIAQDRGALEPNPVSLVQIPELPKDLQSTGASFPYASASIRGRRRNRET